MESEDISDSDLFDEKLSTGIVRKQTESEDISDSDMFDEELSTVTVRKQTESENIYMFDETAGSQNMPIVIQDSPVKVPAPKRKTRSFDDSDTSGTERISDKCFEEGESFDDSANSTPVYKLTSRGEQFTMEQLAKIVILEDVDESLICERQPTCVCKNSTFVVNLHSLEDPCDIRADDNGVWIRSGSPVTYVSIHNGKEIYKRSKLGKHPHHYKLVRTYFRHRDSPDFRRIITTAEDWRGQLLKLSFVQYAFDNNEHPIQVSPHGNSKGKKPYKRTKPSTLHSIQKGAKSMPPLQVLAEVENKAGGILGAKAGCDLPRNRQQVYNAKKSHKTQSDTLAEIMRVCKETIATSDAFIQSVEAAPEPMCVLATPQQLTDLERFCTAERFCVLSADPTFNLGPFYVTPLTYQNLLMQSVKSANHPLMLGPVLVHQTKTFHAFSYLASTLVRLKPMLRKIKAFGTDGESELIRAFQIAFPDAVHLRCTNHLRQNVKDKLTAIGIHGAGLKHILADVFGEQVGSHFEHGLVDAANEGVFYKQLKSLEERWNNLEMSFSLQQPQFYTWFMQHKAPVIVASVLPEVRKKAQICGTPLPLFTTNQSESINSVIKRQVEWKESKLPELVNHLKAICDRQMAETQKTVIGRGDQWKFDPKYSHLEVQEHIWFQKSQQQKNSHLKKVMTTTPVVPDTSSTSTNHSQVAATRLTHLDVSIENSGITTIALDTLRAIWTKADKLISSEGHVMQASWLPSKSRFVKSTSADKPHLVNVNPKVPHQYCCDGSCPMYKGFSICSHTVATAQANRELRSFVDWFVHQNRKPNLSEIAHEGMSKGVGRKGGAPKRKRTHRAPIESCSSKFAEQSCTSSAAILPQPLPASDELSTTPLLTSPTLATVSVSSSVEHANMPTNSTHVAKSQVLISDQTKSTTTAISTLHTTPPAVSAPTTTSQGQLALVTLITQLARTEVSNPSHNHTNPTKPFVLKLRTTAIRICQGCRQELSDSVVVSRLERRLIQNTHTGAFFYGKECNSHYHTKLTCLQRVCPGIDPSNILIPDNVRAVITHTVLRDLGVSI